MSPTKSWKPSLTGIDEDEFDIDEESYGYQAYINGEAWDEETEEEIIERWLTTTT